MVDPTRTIKGGRARAALTLLGVGAGLMGYIVMALESLTGWLHVIGVTTPVVLGSSAVAADAVDVLFGGPGWLTGGAR